MRTLTVKKGGGSDYATGWHTLTISDAKYGDWEGKKFLDVWFSGYPENFTMRVYEKKNKDGEEFAIGQVFRFANAGITDGLDGPDGNVVVKIDDDVNNLKGHQLNVGYNLSKKLSIEFTWFDNKKKMDIDYRKAFVDLKYKF